MYMFNKIQSYFSLVMILLVLVLGYLPQDSRAKSNIDWDKKLAKGFYQMEVGNYDKAAAFFQTEIDKHPECAQARTGLGMSLKKMGKLGEAKSSLRRACEVNPDYPESQYELGCMLESDKEYDEALKCFEKYLQLAPLSNKKVTVEERIRACQEAQ